MNQSDRILLCLYENTLAFENDGPEKGRPATVQKLGSGLSVTIIVHGVKKRSFSNAEDQISEQDYEELTPYINTDGSINNAGRARAMALQPQRSGGTP